MKLHLVILKGLENWRKWIELMRSVSAKAELWDYVNPSPIAGQTLQILTAPVRPTPRSVSATAETYATLSTDKREQLRILQADYSYDLQKYDR